MDERALTNRRIGLWSAAGVVAIWMVFAIVGVIGVVARPGADPLNPVEPFLAIFEVLIVLAAMVLVVMMASVHTYAPPDRKNCSLAALAFMSGGAVLTSNAHFAALTVGRQIDAKVFPWLSRQFAFGETWPSLAKAMDLLAWDVFVGLSLLLAATAFRGDPLQDRIRIGMIVGGMLSDRHPRPFNQPHANPILGDCRLCVCPSGGLPHAGNAVCTGGSWRDPLEDA